MSFSLYLNLFQPNLMIEKQKNCVRCVVFLREIYSKCIPRNAEYKRSSCTPQFTTISNGCSKAPLSKSTFPAYECATERLCPQPSLNILHGKSTASYLSANAQTRNSLKTTKSPLLSVSNLGHRQGSPLTPSPHSANTQFQWQIPTTRLNWSRPNSTPPSFEA